MTNANNRTKTYAIIAAVSIGILAVSLVGGLWVSNGPVIQTANGNSVVTSNDDCLPGSKVHCIDSPGSTSTLQEGVRTAETTTQGEKDNDSFVLFVTGTAFKKISPDKVSVTLGVETQDTTAQAAARRNAEIMNAIVNALKEQGITSSQISTSYYNIYPVYDYEKIPMTEPMIVPPYPGRQILVGYRASNTITVTAAASQDVGSIIDAATEAGANQVQGVSYFVSEELQQQMNNELIGQAVLNAKMKAEKALAPLNMQIVGVKNLNLNEVFYPIYRYDMSVAAAEGAPTPIFPTEQQVSASVSVTFLIGSK